MKERMLYTPVAVERAGFDIGFDDKVMLVGSCFTENMGKKMEDLGFCVNINPYGILYNPLSLADAMTRCMDNVKIVEEDLVCRDGLWHSWHHHGSFSRREKSDCLDVCNASTEKANHFLAECNTLIVTMGSSWLYRIEGNAFGEQNNGMAVGNCHKVPASSFRKTIASVEEIVEAWKPLCKRLIDSGKRLVFTVSPVRHNAYGAHGNALGKAILLVAIDKLVNELSCDAARIAYFPSYEIVMDELRDYRFYADDMLHPSSLAEEIVWQRFQQTFMSKETMERCDEEEKRLRRMSHRALH